MSSYDQAIQEAIEFSQNNQKVILESNPISSINYKKCGEPAIVEIRNEDVLYTTLWDNGDSTTILNFANAMIPGGAVDAGGSGQEESLCRSSTLLSALKDPYVIESFYKQHRLSCTSLANDDIVYTPRVLFFRDLDQSIRPMHDWYYANVISCAAPNLCGMIMDPNSLLKIQAKRIKRILDVALVNDNDTVILGAFGCGAFKNPPIVVASAIKYLMKYYQYSFNKIIFSITDADIYSVFKSILEDYEEMSLF